MRTAQLAIITIGLGTAVLLIGLVLWRFAAINNPPYGVRVLPSPTVARLPGKTVRCSRKNCLFTISTASPDGDIILVPNFTGMKSSSDIIRSYGCSRLVNGGFYGKDGSPIGYFRNGSTILSKTRSSRTFNAFLSCRNSSCTIGYDAPDGTEGWGFQTGPMLIDNGSPVLLSLSNDEETRRNVAALDGNGRLIFISVYGEESFLDGPLLAELPGIVSSIGKTLDSGIVMAANLDGGTHSAFVTPDISIHESNPVGSAICIR